MNKYLLYGKYILTGSLFTGITVYGYYYFTKKIFSKVISQLEQLEDLIYGIEFKYTLTANRKNLKLSKATETNFCCDDNDFLKVKNYNNDISTLKNMKASDWIYDKELINVYENMSVTEALNTLQENSGTCALVYDSQKQLLGVMDTHDVLSYILRSSSSLLESSAKKIVRKCVIADGNISVNEVCKNLCNGFRHIAIKKEDDYQIVSQRSLVEAIYHVSNENEDLSAILENTVEESGIGTRGILISCKSENTAREAFQLMAAYSITSLPIINNESVCGVISATNVLYSRFDSYHMNLNVLEYIEKSRSEAGVYRDPSTVVSCTLDDTLMTVLQIMMYEKVHHIYILDSERLEGVISFVDLLKFFSLYGN